MEVPATAAARAAASARSDAEAAQAAAEAARRYEADRVAAEAADKIAAAERARAEEEASREMLAEWPMGGGAGPAMLSLLWCAAV